MAIKLLEPNSLWENKIFSGAWISGGGDALEVTDKSTGRPVWSLGSANAADVDAAVKRAVMAQREWAKVPAPHRGDIVRKAAQLVLEYGEEIAAQIVQETGSIRPKGAAEVHMTSREILEAAATAGQPSGALIATEVPGRTSIARRIPIGVVGVITPWNSPFLLASRAIAPALVAGNAVVLKPDPQSPVCGGVTFARIFEEAGLPKGLFHVLPGGVETGEALVRHPQVKMISFTGSTKVGRHIGEVAGGQLKRVSLELGGNNPLIVLDDVDIDAAAGAGGWGSFFHQGQICLCVGRHIVHENIVDAYAQALSRRAQSLKVGDPFRGEVHLGPIINEKQAANVERIVIASVKAGARILTGGTRSGLFFEPTVMVDVKPGMPVFDEETFGPVAPIISFKNDEEAVELANATEFGLVASVLSPNLARAQRIADQLHSGIVHINDQSIQHEVYGPIGGVGISGNGYNYSTLTNPDQFSEWQWVTSRSEIARPPF